MIAKFMPNCIRPAQSAILTGVLSVRNGLTQQVSGDLVSPPCSDWQTGEKKHYPSRSMSSFCLRNVGGHSLLSACLAYVRRQADFSPIIHCPIATWYN